MNHEVTLGEWPLPLTTVVSISLFTSYFSLKALLKYLLPEIFLDFVTLVRISAPCSDCLSTLLKGDLGEVGRGGTWRLMAPPLPCHLPWGSIVTVCPHTGHWPARQA